MNNLVKIILSIMGGCNVVIEMVTPLAIVLFWCSFFNYTNATFIFLLCAGGLASIFRAIKVGLMK